MGAPVPGTYRHEPVLLDEACSLLGLGPGMTVVDGTVGGGGHARAILDRTAPDGRLVGLDVDAEALLAAQERLGSYGDRLRLVRSSFRNLTAVLEEPESRPWTRCSWTWACRRISSTRPRALPLRRRRRARTPLDMRMDTERRTRPPTSPARPRDARALVPRHADLPGAPAGAIAERRTRAPLRSARPGRLVRRRASAAAASTTRRLVFRRCGSR
jgi:16S rRNA (cytosine1402-N4)-methyltransferase